MTWLTSKLTVSHVHCLANPKADWTASLVYNMVYHKADSLSLVRNMANLKADRTVHGMVYFNGDSLSRL